MKISKGTIERVKPFLKNGLYFINHDNTQIYSRSSEEIFHFGSYKKDLKFYIKKIISRFKLIVIKTSHKHFYGKIILFPSNNYGFKVFNDIEVLTYYKNHKDLDCQLHNRYLIDAIFNTPEIIKINNNYLIEKRINNNLFDDAIFLKYLIEQYSNYLSQNNLRVENIKDLNKKYYDSFKEIYDYIKSFDSYICCIQHGDLWKGNVIKDFENNYYLLDYENVSEKYFLYDFFFYIYTNIQIFGDYSLLHLYFSSYFDTCLKNLFKVSNSNFDKKLKLEYFNTFLNQYISCKFKNYTYDEFNVYINKLYEIAKYAHNCYIGGKNEK